MDSGGQRRPAKESHLSCWIVKSFSRFLHLPKVPPTLVGSRHSSSGIDAQNLGEIRDLRQVPQCVIRLLALPTQ